MDNSKYCEEIMEEWEEHDLNKIEEGFQDAGEEKLAEDENVLERCNKRWEKGENC